MMRIYCKLILQLIILISAGTLFSQALIVDEVTAQEITISLDTSIGIGTSSYTLFEVFDVYEMIEVIDGYRVGVNLIDSIYLNAKEENNLYFAYIWEGESKYIKEGYVLFPTGREYIPKELPKKIKEIPEKKIEKVKLRLFELYVFTGSAINFSEGDLFGLNSYLIIQLLDYGIKAGINSGPAFGKWILEASGDAYGSIAVPWGALRIYSGIGVDIPLYTYLDTSQTGNFAVTADIGLLSTLEGVFPGLLGNITFDVFYKGKIPLKEEYLDLNFDNITFLSSMVISLGYRI